MTMPDQLAANNRCASHCVGSLVREQHLSGSKLDTALVASMQATMGLEAGWFQANVSTQKCTD